MMKKFITLAGVLCALALPLFAQDAASIITQSRDRIQADTVSTRSRMVITARDGSTTERVLDQYSADGPSGNRTLIVFQRPASVAGTRFLTLANAGGAEDRWIFLPALGKERRINASEGSGSFMGTDFSYDDISSADRDAGKDTHTLTGTEVLNGRGCQVITSVPRASSWQYSKMVSWIDSETLVAWKIELYDDRGTLVKVLEVQKVEDVQGRLTPMVTKMSTLASGTSTTIFVDLIKYDDRIPEAVFTTDYLILGRLR